MLKGHLPRVIHHRVYSNIRRKYSPRLPFAGILRRRGPARPAPVSQVASYLTDSAYKVVLQESIPAQIRRLVLYISDNKEPVDGFVREFDFCTTTL